MGMSAFILSVSSMLLLISSQPSFFFPFFPPDSRVVYFGRRPSEKRVFFSWHKNLFSSLRRSEMLYFMQNEPNGKLAAGRLTKPYKPQMWLTPAADTLA
ncbi:hypothetical protein BCR43DRAFT_492722 [Syncephalastrum racemosum]|uniref:Uncharacterized protein n=1 Tax=Syncephalastrum racemosum TaxID=13706 RepID=A0A1X2H9E9_SYNRA|nr:hypothetical protein BCR43DRAFT_492722 [Syncephalastrum racemosum]